MRKRNITGNLKDYFSFSKTERNGIVFLLILLLLVISGNFFIPALLPAKSSGDYNAFKSRIDSLYELDTIKQEKFVPELKSKELNEYPPKSIKKTVIELNNCDSASLTSLPGIGPVFASRIIKYRRLLGGYYSIYQVKEVYGMQPENFEKARDYLKVNLQLVQKFLPDTASFKTLVRHPYIGKERTSKILNLKKTLQNGIFSENDLKTAEIFDSLQWAKISPYFIFRNNP